MVARRKTRIIIVDRDGRLAGVMSLADIAEHEDDARAMRTIRGSFRARSGGPRDARVDGQTAGRRSAGREMRPRTTTTVQCASRTTACATEPRLHPPRPVWPRVPMTMTS